MAKRDLVVVGASAGGIEALQQILAGLPKDLNAAVLIVLHTSSHPESLLPQILQRSCKLSVVHPKDGEEFVRGKVYIARPDFHLIVEGRLLRVIQGPRENLHRPAIDPLFRSAAASYGPRVIGVILTGSLDDGTAGLMVVRARGGAAIVQSPSSAMFPSMPRSALQQVPDATPLLLPQIAEAITALTHEEVPDAPPVDPATDSEVWRETKLAEGNMSEIENEEGHPGHPSSFACPDCGGVLWEIEENGFLRFRCRVGHAFTVRHLGAEQRHAVETALWSALRALEESASLYKRMADRAVRAEHPHAAQTYSDRVANTTENARVLRDFLIKVNEQEEERFTVEET